MIRLVRLPIRQVGGYERLAPGFEIIQPLHPEFFQIEQMSSLFLNRPLVAVSPRQQFSRQSARQFFESRRRAADALDDVREHLDRQIEREFAVEPLHMLLQPRLYLRKRMGSGCYGEALDPICRRKWY